MSNIALDADLDCPSGIAINIWADNVIFDGNGHKIIGNLSVTSIYANGHSNITIKNITCENAVIGMDLININGLNLDNITINGGGLANGGLQITNSTGITFDANGDGLTTKIAISGVKGNFKNGTWRWGIIAGAALYLENINGIAGTPLVIDPNNFSFFDNGITIGLNNVSYVTIKDFVGTNAIIWGTTTDIGGNYKIGIDFNRFYNDTNYSSNVVIDNVEFKDLTYGIYAPAYDYSVPHQNLSLKDNIITNNTYGVSLSNVTDFQFFHNNIYNNTLNFDSTTWYTLSWNFRWHTGLNSWCFFVYNNPQGRTPYDANRTDIIDTNCYYDENARKVNRRSYGLISLLMSLGWLENIPWLEDSLWNKFNAKNIMNALPILVGQTYDLILGYTNTLWRVTNNDKMDTEFHFKVPLPDGIGTGNTGKIEMKVKFFTAP